MNDALCISTDDDDFKKNNIGKYLLIKPGSVGYPNIYLGDNVLKMV